MNSKNTINRKVNVDELGGTLNIKVLNDHIWFYEDIDTKSAIELNTIMLDVANTLLKSCVNTFLDLSTPPPIWLHINSGGGHIHDAFSIVDTMTRIKTAVPIITIIEGRAMSAATFIALAGNKRLMQQHAYTLIHQLSTGMYGTFENLSDEFSNCKMLMKDISEMYEKNTKMPKDKIKELLKKDLYLDAKTCLKYGIIDQII
jgi:ATP-dependent Clp endopeptidase proteolytic subunit ClpP